MWIKGKWNEITKPGFQIVVLIWFLIGSQTKIPFLIGRKDHRIRINLKTHARATSMIWSVKKMAKISIVL